MFREELWLCNIQYILKTTKKNNFQEKDTNYKTAAKNALKCWEMMWNVREKWKMKKDSLCAAQS